jgi:hypothetical protein
METVGSVVSSTGFATLTVTEAEPTLLAASKALTVSVCEPLGWVALFQEKEKGEEAAVATATPSTSSAIFVTPILSVAVPCTKIVAAMVAPVMGAETDTVSAVESPPAEAP